ncbi:MAG TPA: acetate--CoA ligase family protein [Solirubrobacteraceae bacterium]|nr:acetate--CoA ligase family protein [Solirubrobacteraceae bacterium]
MAARGEDVALRDGSTVALREMRRSDARELGELFDALTPESRWLRFLGQTDGQQTAAILARSGTGVVAVRDGRIVAHACFVRAPDQSAEVGFAVADERQGLGLGTLLLGRLAELAADQGVTVFTAIVHPSNRRMLDVFRASGFAPVIRPARGVLEVEMPAQPGEEALRRFLDRDDTAAVAAVGHVLAPAALAVVGDRWRPGSPAGAVVRNIVRAGYAGQLYPVTPRHRSVAGCRAHRSVEAIPGPVELAIVAVAAPRVAEVARACAAKGVRALVVLSEGFAESGAEGRARQDELLEICRGAGMRLVGPNCLGVINADPAVGLDATFAPSRPATPGRLAYASQSGAFGIAALELLARRGLGLSAFVSLGDKADISGNDLLRYWERDAGTDAVLLYLESLGNPRRFGQIVRRMSARTPVIVVKAGRSVAGRRAATSHTGALVGASEEAVDALFAHAGVIRVPTLDEQLDVAAALARGPLPRGRRVGIVTNAGGPGVACADACAAAGLDVEPLDEDAQAALRSALPTSAAVSNPVDVLAGASARDLGRAVRIAGSAAAVDAVIAIHIAPIAGRSAGPPLRAIARAARPLAAAGVPVLLVAMPSGQAPEGLDLPVYATPEHAARALAHVVRHAERARESPEPVSVPADVDDERAAAVLARALEAGPGQLGPEAAAELLEAYGVRLARQETVEGPEAVGRAAARLGGDVAVKALVPGVVRKREAGAVRLALRGPAEARAAARQLARALGAQRFLVQEMAPAGVELLVGATSDPLFGPVVAVAAGGPTAELAGDVQARLAPLARSQVAAMLRRLRTFPLLEGYHGGPVADIAAVEDLVVRIAALADAQPAIAELDLDPVIATPTGVVTVDARVRIAEPPPEHELVPTV